MVAATNRTLKMTSLEMRTKLGLTQLAWAQALNVSYNTVNNWETWGKPPKGLSTEVLNGIAAAIEATPWTLHHELGRRIARVGVGGLLTFGLVVLPEMAAEARAMESAIRVDARAWVPLPDGHVTTLSDWIAGYTRYSRAKSTTSG